MSSVPEAELELVPETVLEVVLEAELEAEPEAELEAVPEPVAEILSWAQAGDKLAMRANTNRPVTSRQPGAKEINPD